MPKENKPKGKLLCVDDIRHSEYYNMQIVFDELYKRSKNHEDFTDLMSIITSKENVLLAYRNIKTNSGSKTVGTDNITIQDIGKLSPDEVIDKVRFILTGSKHGYRPKPVRRKDIPKPNGTTRPLGIPCMWDRLIQQCIKQVIEPICEAKFSDNSYGFRPNRSVENAIAKLYFNIQTKNLHYICEFDVKSFFDNVNHSKLIKQIWAMRIKDKALIYILKQILKAPIKMPDGKIVIPTKGTPQGGIISPLLANIVLNELDHWVDSQWEENPHVYSHWKLSRDKEGNIKKSHGYEWMRKYTTMKELHIIRYADDFRILCKSKEDAEKSMIAIKKFLSQRLGLEVSEEKTGIVNLKNRYSEFLGFKMKLVKKRNKYVIKSHMCDKAFERSKKRLCDQAKRIAKPRKEYGEIGEIHIKRNSIKKSW